MLRHRYQSCFGEWSLCFVMMAWVKKIYDGFHEKKIVMVD